jgi:hypothetical protein
VKRATYSTYRKGPGEEVKGYYMYLIAKVVGETEVSEDLLQLTLSDPYKKGQFTATIKKDYFQKRYLDKNKVFNADYYVSCLVRSEGEGIRIVKLASIPVVRERGFVVQSSKETEFAEYLINTNRLFYRPAKLMEKYVPDFMVLSKDKNTISAVVVSSFYSEQYKKNIIEKVNALRDNKTSSLIVWKANEKEPMPEIQ